MNLILEKSSDIFRLVLSVGLMICVLIVAFEVLMIRGADGTGLQFMERRLTPILLMTGVLITAFLVVRTENALAISISVLIIGTVVAGDRFLLSITALLTDNAGAGDFVTEIYQSGLNATTPLADPEQTQNIAEDIVARILEAQQKGGEEAAVSVAASYISQAEVSRIAEEVSALGYSETLRRIYNTPALFVADLPAISANASFQRSMATLRQFGLISFPGTDYASVVVTEQGGQVAEALNLPFEVAPVVVEAEPTPSDALADLDLSVIPEVVVQNTERVVPLEWEDGTGTWLLVTLEDKSFVVMETSDEKTGVDPILTLYDMNKEFVAGDDDGGEDLNSRIVAELEAGTYLLSIADLRGQGGYLALTVRR